MNSQPETLTLNYPDGGRTVLPLARGTIRKWERAAARRKITVEEYTRRYLIGLLDRTKQAAASYGRREMPELLK